MPEKKIDTLEPKFRAKVELVLKDAEEATGRRWVLTDARRTMAEQRRIYAQGRTAPGKVVSNAPPGSSAHNYGLAADLAPLMEMSSQIDWGAPRGMWRVMADIARSHGLNAGYYFKTILDMPHIEDPKWREQRALWRAGKLEVA